MRRTLRLASGLAGLQHHPNIVLRNVFLAPRGKVAIVEEVLHPAHAVESLFSPPTGHSDAASTVTREVTYGELLDAAAQLATAIRNRPTFPPTTLVEEHDESGVRNVALLQSPGANFVASVLAAWMCGLMVVPLCPSHRLETELRHVFSDSRANWLLYEDAVARSVSRSPDEPSPQREGSTSPLDPLWRTALAPVKEEPNPNADQRTEARSREFGFVTESIDVAAHLRNAPTANTTGEGEVEVQHVAEETDALMIYTSGTTAKPKGVVHTHRSASNQVETLLTAWGWKSADRIVNFLPLHHVHGLVNIVLCALAAQATCVMAHQFHATAAARRLTQGDLTVLMAVPTIYAKLLRVYDGLRGRTRLDIEQFLALKFRLMVSGSAALPPATLEQWKTVSGHVLLERYGMTETGMALSQPLSPVSQRVPGTVGWPLPGVAADVEIEPDFSVAPHSPYVRTGELLLTSPSMFHRYWRNPKATAKEFVVREANTSGAAPTRWFRTGDIVGTYYVNAQGTRRPPHEAPDPTDVETFAILGRASVDIIKASGYKVSALEIEAALLEEPTILSEVAVFGMPDAVRGESIVAAVALKDTSRLGTKRPSDGQVDVFRAVRVLAEERLAHYKVPSTVHLCEKGLPRNAMGKINKKELRAMFEAHLGQLGGAGRGGSGGNGSGPRDLRG